MNEKPKQSIWEKMFDPYGQTQPKKSPEQIKAENADTQRRARQGYNPSDYVTQPLEKK